MSATVYKSVVLRCDHPNCLVKSTHVCARIMEARREACSEGGWRYVNLPVPSGGPAVSADLCPDHIDYEITLAEVRPLGARKVG